MADITGGNGEGGTSTDAVRLARRQVDGEPKHEKVEENHTDDLRHGAQEGDGNAADNKEGAPEDYGAEKTTGGEVAKAGIGEAAGQPVGGSWAVVGLNNGTADPPPTGEEQKHQHEKGKEEKQDPEEAEEQEDASERQDSEGNEDLPGPEDIKEGSYLPREVTEWAEYMQSLNHQQFVERQSAEGAPRRADCSEDEECEMQDEPEEET